MALCVGVSVLCSTAHAADAPRASDAPARKEAPTWFRSMDDLSATLTRLLVTLLPANKTLSPAEQKAVRSDAHHLSALARTIHGLGNRAAPDGDPSLLLISGLFVGETERLSRAVDRGHYESARDLARGTATYCISCHTRSDWMGAFAPAAQQVDTSALQPLDRVHLLMATHRFADARASLDTVLRDPQFAQRDTFAWEQAVTDALVVEVRTQRSPAGALALLDRLAQSPATAQWRDMNTWRASLTAWQQELQSPQPAAPDLLAQGASLVERAQGVSQGPGDRAADVLYLRATATLHDFLATRPHGVDAARAFSLLSIAYQRLRDVGVYALARLYDEACIREAPHTDLSRMCFERYADAVHADELGNSGGPLPGEWNKHMLELAALAGAQREPKRPTPKDKATDL